jgi:hypothetical protein
MQFEYPSQRLQDYLSQRWVQWRGRRVEPRDIDWLMGPYGEVDAIADHYIQRLADEEDLTIERHATGAGLLDSADAFGLDAATLARLRPEIAHFYERTADHDLEVWSEWSPVFRPFGGMLQTLYSRRLQQLNLPLRPLDTSRGISSEIVKLRDAEGRAKYTVWYRTLKSTGQVVYSGVYTTCVTPAGDTCVKVIFPLPCGNATVLMRIGVGENGELDLVSSGERFGDPGFYFMLHDRHQQHWAQYIRSFRERIFVYVDDEGVLRTDHSLTLWGRRVLQLHYKIMAAPARTPSSAGLEVNTLPA